MDAFGVDDLVAGPRAVAALEDRLEQGGGLVEVLLVGEDPGGRGVVAGGVEEGGGLGQGVGDGPGLPGVGGLPVVAHGDGAAGVAVPELAGLVQHAAGAGGQRPLVEGFRADEAVDAADLELGDHVGGTQEAEFEVAGGVDAGVEKRPAQQQ